jgi:flagellar hook-associated protein 1 FlgK
LLFEGAPDALDEEAFDGITFTLTSTTLNEGDRFELDPFAGAAGQFRLVLDKPEGLAMNRAALSPSVTSSADPPTTALTLEPVQALNTALPAGGLILKIVDISDPADPEQLVLEDQSTGDQFIFELDSALTLAPYEVTLTLTEAAEGDQVTLSAKSAGAADGGQALRLSEDNAIFDSGDREGDRYGALLAQVGAATNRAKLSAEATEVSVLDAQARRDAFSGVSLDEEAADLLRFQQAYQAAARVVSVADSLFQSILTVVR